MRTLHVGLRVEDPERSLEFYENLGYEVVGTVSRKTVFGDLTMLKLPDDDVVSLERRSTHSVDDFLSRRRSVRV